MSKILLQWALANPTDWVEIDASQWATLPKKPDRTGSPAGVGVDNTPGYINQINIQGLVPTADHYAVEQVDNETVRLTTWNDDPAHAPVGMRYAVVATIKTLAPDSRFGGAINTRQSFVVYAEETTFAKFVLGQWPDVRSWSEFVPPAEAITRHGRQLSNTGFEQSRKATRLVGWREFTDGLPASEVVNGRVPAQRRRLPGTKRDSRYNVPRGTKTFYCSNTALATGLHAASYEFEIKTGTATAGSQACDIGKGAAALAFCFTGAVGTPNDADWPSGSYRCQLDCTVNSYVSFGLLTLSTAVGHFARVNSTLTTEAQTWAQAEAAFTATGLSLATTGTIDPSAGAAGDRFECLVAGYVPGTKNGTFTLELNEADDYVDGPWAGSLLVTITLDQPETSDSAVTQRTGYYTRIVEDSAVATDAVDVAKEAGAINRSAIDDITATDSAARQTWSTRASNDSCDLQDFIALAIAYNRVAIDNCGNNDVATSAMFALFQLNIAHTVSASATVDRSIAFERTSTDDTAVADIADRETETFSKSVDITDIAIVADSTEISATWALFSSDSCSSSDSAGSGGSNYSRFVYDEVSTTCSGQLILTNPPSGHDPVLVLDTLARVGDSTRTVFDTSEISDDLVVQTQGMQTRTATDSVAIDDVLVRIADSVRTAADAIAVVDTGVNNILALYYRTVEDAIAVADQVTTSQTLICSCNDTISASDSYYRDASSTRQLTDSISTVDQVGTSRTLACYATDAASTSDSVSRTGSFDLLPVDSIVASDTVLRATNSQRCATDTIFILEAGDVDLQRDVTTHDATAIAIQFLCVSLDTATVADLCDVQLLALAIRSASDSITISDLVDTELQLALLAIDFVEATDTTTRIASTLRSIQDTIVAIDVTSTSSSGFDNVVLFDSLSVPDSVLHVTNSIRNATDTVAIADLATAEQQQLRAGQDSITVADTDTAQLYGLSVRSQIDSIEVADLNRQTVAFGRNSSDAIDVSDSTSTTISLDSRAADNVVITDTGIYTVSAERLVADSIAVTDTSDTAAICIRQVADIIAVPDLLVRDTGSARICSDSIPISDAGATELQLHCIATDTSSVLDLTVSDIVAWRSCTDTSSISDATTIALYGLNRVLAEDAVSASDLPARALQAERGIVDSPSIVDLTDRSTDTRRRVEDAVDLTALGQISAASEYVRVGSDSATTADSAFGTLEAERAYSDNIATTDDLAVEELVSIIYRTVEEEVSVYDEILEIGASDRQIADGPVVADQILRVASSLRQVADSVSLTAVVSTTMGLTVSVTDTCAVLDHVGSELDAARSLTDAIVCTDTNDTELQVLRASADELTVFDYAYRVAWSARQLTDVVDVNDVLQVTSAEILDIVLVDDIAAYDTLKRATESIRIGSTACLVVDSLSYGLARDLELVNEISTNDIVECSVAITSVVTDIVDIVDVIARRGDQARPVVDTCTTTDLVSCAETYHVVCDDAIVAPDLTVRDVDQIRSCATTAVAEDTAAGVLVISRSQSDTVLVFDQIDQVADSTRLVSESCTTADLTTTELACYRSIAVSTVVSDQVAVTADSARAAATTIDTADTVDIASVHTRVVYDSILTTDATLVPRELERVITDAVVATATTVRVTDSVRAIADAVGTIDQLQLAAAEIILVVVSDELSVTDVTIRSTDTSRAVSDVCLATEVVASGSERSYGLTDTMVVSDTLVRTTTFERLSQDTAVATDQAASTFFLLRQALDAASTADGAIPVVEYLRRVQDGIEVSDQTLVASFLLLARAVADGCMTADLALRYADLLRRTSDAPATADQTYTALDLARSLTDTPSVSDTTYTALEATRYTGDTAGASDQLDTEHDSSRVRAGSVNVYDQAGAQISALVHLSDQVVTADWVTAARTAYSTREVSDALGLTDQARRQAEFGRAVSDAPSTVDHAGSDKDTQHLHVELQDAVVVTDVEDSRSEFQRVLRDLIGAAMVAGGSNSSPTVWGWGGLNITVSGWGSGAIGYAIGLYDIAARELLATRGIEDLAAVFDNVWAKGYSYDTHSDLDIPAAASAILVVQAEASTAATLAVEAGRVLRVPADPDVQVWEAPYATVLLIVGTEAETELVLALEAEITLQPELDSETEAFTSPMASYVLRVEADSARTLALAPEASRTVRLPIAHDVRPEAFP